MVHPDVGGEGGGDGQKVSCYGDAIGSRDVWVPACPRSRLTSPCFLILMSINHFCSVSASRKGQEGREKYRKKRAESPYKRQSRREIEREPLIEKFLTADKLEKEMQFTAQIGLECVAR